VQVRDAMTHRAEWVGPDETLHEAARKMRELGIGARSASAMPRPIPLGWPFAPHFASYPTARPRGAGNSCAEG